MIAVWQFLELLDTRGSASAPLCVMCRDVKSVSEANEVREQGADLRVSEMLWRSDLTYIIAVSCLYVCGACDVTALATTVTGHLL